MEKIYTQLLSLISNESRHLAPTLEQFKADSNKYLIEVSPKKTLGISLTDNYCEQRCAHCNGHYLNGMTNLSEISQKDLNSYEALLLSGGSNKLGEVPFKEFINQILNFPAHLRLNIHPGFQSPLVL